MDKYTDLKNRCIAIGSLPYTDLSDTLSIIKRYSYDIPFVPQLKNYSKNEDMLIQYLEGMPAVSCIKDKIFINELTKNFLDKSEELLNDFEEIKNNINSSKLDKYAISSDYSAAFQLFIDYIKENNPKYAKTQITGPFTLSVNILCDNSEKSCFNQTVVEVIAKTLALKALWQIREIKKINSEIIPIIFIDEPTVSQIDKSEYEKISKKDMFNYIKLISDLIKSNGGISAIHCCGKCNWSSLLHLGLDMINFDAYTYAEDMVSYAEDLKIFLEKNGKIVWGIVPTLEQQDLQDADILKIEQKLQSAKEVLINNGIDKNLIENNLLISPSCGCATLSVELTEKAFKLAHDLSKKLKG